MSNFDNDILGEKYTGNFLDVYYYPNTIFKDKFERVHDKERQLKGIDVIAKTNNGLIKIDEKAAISFKYTSLNSLRTFSLEIDFISYSNTISEGWLVKEGLETDFYLFCFLDRDRDKRDIESIDDIYFIETMLVSKSKLLNYLKEFYSLDIKDLKRNAIEIRRNYNKNGVNNIRINSNNTRFYISEEVSEKTLNLLLDRAELKKISTFNHLVFSDKYKHLNSNGTNIKVLK